MRRCHTARREKEVVAKKHTEDHGGVLTLQQAIYHAVHDFQPGGLPAVAAVYGWNPATLRNKISPTVATHKVSAEEVEQILELTRDPRIITALLHPNGAVWHWEDEVVADPADLDVLGCGSAVFNRASAAVDELVASLDDGKVSDDEMARIKQRSYELRQALVKLEKAAEGFAE